MRTMNWLLFAIAVALATPADAQGTQQSTGVPTPRYAPFGSDWAKPFPQTGGYFYNDPRFQGSNQPLRPNRICPPGRRCL